MYKCVHRQRGAGDTHRLLHPPSSFYKNVFSSFKPGKDATWTSCAIVYPRFKTPKNGKKSFFSLKAVRRITVRPAVWREPLIYAVSWRSWRCVSCGWRWNPCLPPWSRCPPPMDSSWTTAAGCGWRPWPVPCLAAPRPSARASRVRWSWGWVSGTTRTGCLCRPGLATSPRHARSSWGWGCRPGAPKGWARARGCRRWVCACAWCRHPGRTGRARVKWVSSGGPWSCRRRVARRSGRATATSPSRIDLGPCGGGRGS